MFCKKNVTNICLLFPFLFLFELILGYSGKMVTVCSVPIRTILFALSFFSLYFCLFCYLRKNKIKFLALNDKKSFLGSFNLVDDAMLLLLFSVAIFSTVIPAVVGTDLKMAAREVLSPFLVMTLFFPISYFIKSKIFYFLFITYLYAIIFRISLRDRACRGDDNEVRAIVKHFYSYRLYHTSDYRTFKTLTVPESFPSYTCYTVWCHYAL